MKKIISLALVCVLLVGAALALASCGKMLSGKYEADVGVAGAKYEFSGKKVTITVQVLGFEKSYEGTYKIGENDDGKETITFDFDENKDVSKYEGTFLFAEKETDDGVKYITIGGVPYKKVK